MPAKIRADRIFLGLSSFQALAMFRRGIFYTFLAVYLRAELGLSVTETTLFETIPMILNVLFQTFVWGRLTDHLQKRRSLIIVGELLASAGHILMWYFHAIAPNTRASAYVIITSLTIIEAFWSMSNIGWSAYISDAYDVEERNAVQGSFASIGGLGRIAGAMAGGLLYDAMGKAPAGWGYSRGSIFFTAAFVMAVSVIPLFFMPEGGVDFRKKEEKAPPARLKASGKAKALTTASASSGNSSLLGFLIFLLAMLLVNSGINSLAAFRGQFLDLRDGFAASPPQISLAVNVEAAVLIITGFFIGIMGRKMGIKKLLLFGSAAGIVSMLLHAVAPSLVVVYTGAAFRGLSEGCVASSSYAYASTLIPPEKRGRYFAYYNATFFLSWGVAATFIIGPLIDALIKSGQNEVFAFRMGLASGAVLMVIGLALLLLLFAFGKRKSSIQNGG